MSYRWAGLADVGKLRESNEDVVHPPGSGEDGSVIVAVADGMGGHVGGEVAANLAMSASLALEGSVADRIVAANQAIVDRAEEDPSLAGMGTTLTLAVLSDDEATIGHVGDSRAYLLRHGGLSRLTRDHTVVADLVATGRLSPEEADHHPYRNLLTRAVGLEENLVVDVVELDLEEGDRLLLCSDGLYGMLDDESILGVLNRDDEPEPTARRLIDAANSAGGHDNVAVVVVDVVT